MLILWSVRSYKHLLSESHICWDEPECPLWNAVLTSDLATAHGGEPIEEISQAIETPIEEGAEPVKVRTVN